MSELPTILLVEDDAAVQDTIRRLLELDGHRVKTAANGREALNFLQGATPPSLILLDMHMPDLDGWGFLKEARSIPGAENVPVLILTGTAGANPVWAAALGAADCVQKPVDPQELRMLVRRALIKP
jgi:CheY-like chemotaxis protein